MCGVSTATVSYVVNNSARPLLPETRERVLKAVAEVGYQPNAYARALKGVRTPVVGVVFPHVTVPLTNVYFGPLLEGIIAQATERRMATMLLTGFTWEETEQGLQREFSGICDGFLLVAPRTDSHLVRDLANSSVPFLIVGSQVAHACVPSIDADNRMGGRLATEHLLALGHTRIGLVMFSDGATPLTSGEPNAATIFSLERRQGYLDALSAAGLKHDPRLTATITGEPTTACSAIHELINLGKPTAVFGCNDGAAFRTIEVCRELGIRVPEDLSVIGFDDISSSATFDPPLTTIRQPISEIGSKAVEMLCYQIGDQPQPAEHHLIPVELIQRRSTSRPNSEF